MTETNKQVKPITTTTLWICCFSLSYFFKKWRSLGFLSNKSRHLMAVFNISVTFYKSNKKLTVKYTIISWTWPHIIQENFPETKMRNKLSGCSFGLKSSSTFYFTFKSREKVLDCEFSGWMRDECEIRHGGTDRTGPADGTTHCSPIECHELLMCLIHSAQSSNLHTNPSM